MTGPKITMILQSVSTTPDAIGGWTESWSNTETLKGVLISRKGDEQVYSGKEMINRAYTFVINGKDATRAARSITTAQRLLYGSTVYDIVNPQDSSAGSGNQINIDILETA